MLENTEMQRYHVRLPLDNGRWFTTEVFKTEKEAIDYVQNYYGADKDGKVHLVAKVTEDNC